MYTSIETQNYYVLLTWCTDGASKDNLHFDDQSKQASFFLFWNFLEEIENMFTVFLSSFSIEFNHM